MGLKELDPKISQNFNIKYYQDIVNKVHSYDPRLNQEVLLKAIDFSKAL